MKFSEFGWILKKYKILLASLTVICFLLGFLFASMFISTSYQARTVLMVTGDSEAKDHKVDYMTILASKELVKTYSEIVPSTIVLKDVARELDFKVTLQELKGAIAITQIGNTELMEIGVVYNDSEKAVEIANTVSKVFIQKAKSIIPSVSIELVDSAVETAVPITPNKSLITFLIGLAGFVSLSGMCLVIEYVRRPIFSKQNIEADFIPFLGQVKKLKYGYKKIAKELGPDKPINNDFWIIQKLLKEYKNVKTILIASSIDGEGKSTVCAGLALTFSKMGHPVTVVDKSQFTSLEELDELLESLKISNELLLIDGEALLNNGWAMHLATKVDGVVLVIKAGMPRSKVLEVVDNLKSVQATFLGAVLNKNI